MKRLVLILTFVFFAIVVYGQTEIKCHKLPASQSLVVSDSFTILPASIQLSHRQAWKLSEDGKSITIDLTDFEADSITICYKTLPVDLTTPYQSKSVALYDSTVLFKPIPGKNKNHNNHEWSDTEGIDKNGSLSRGMSFGNRQNVFVNSAMNLQLSGMITDEIELNALITDSQVPYQPEGNTQQIQDFDRILIELKHEKWNLQAGDVVMQDRNSHFLKYYKNVQGTQFTLQNQVSNWDMQSSIGAAMSKGKFASNDIQPIEGVLGPYRLQGPNGERFIMILANSEQVYLDGLLMKRGFDEDYTIDYNTAEITFTNKRMITKYSRIRIDFEFADQNYGRTNLNFRHEMQTDRVNLFMRFYQEKDNPFKPLFFDLNDQDMQALSELPANSALGSIYGADSIGYTDERTMYMRIDSTLANGQTYSSIYVASTDPERAVYRVTFTEVGEGNGHYRIKNILGNSRIFEWLAPVNNAPMGNYDAVRIVPLPNQRQMMSMGGGVKISKHESVQLELAISNHDENLFSDNNEFNKGQGLKLIYVSEGRDLGIGNWKWNSGLNYEMTSNNFQEIDRFRTIEFDRDWGYQPSDTMGQVRDHISGLFAEVTNDKNREYFRYEINNRQREGFISGWQQKGEYKKQFGKLETRGSVFSLNSRQQEYINSWDRIQSETKWKGKYVVPGYVFNLDHNTLERDEDEFVVNSAMFFEEHRGYLQQGTESNWQWELSQAFRKDQQPIEGSMQLADVSNTSSFSFSSPMVKNQQVSGQFIYRQNQNMLVSDSMRHENSLSGMLKWNADFWQRVISTQVVYTLANSRELNRAFYFQQVGRGMGTHTWRDLNENGLQELNEFFIDNSPYGDRDFVKIFLPTDEYILAYSNALNMRMNIQAPKAWSSKSGAKKMISRFSNVTSLTSSQKNLDDGLLSKINPLVSDALNPNVLSFREQFRSTLFFNRGSALFGGETSFNSRQLKQFLYSGFELSTYTEWAQNIRWRFLEGYNLVVRYAESNKELLSDFQPDRNFTIQTKEVSPEVSRQFGTTFRLAARYHLAQRQVVGDITGGMGSKTHDSQLEVRWMQFSKMSVQASSGFVHVDFNGEENSAVGFELLQALRPGNNMVWNLQWQQQVFGGLQLTLQYFGRKSPVADTFQSGNVQLTAIF